MPKQPKPRKYAEAWTKLKTDGVLLLSVPVVFMPRVKKALIKEKNEDDRFNILNKGFRLQVVQNDAAKTLSFTLKQSPTAIALGADRKIRL